MDDKYKSEGVDHIEELGTGMDILKVAELDDKNPRIKVDWYFLRMVITRLRTLAKVYPDGLADSDIEKTKNYIRKLSMTPEELLLESIFDKKPEI